MDTKGISMAITIKMPRTLKSYVTVEVKKPKFYLVSIINDKHVSWEFCMRVLKEVFRKNYEDSEIIAEQIVTDGEGFCGGYMLEVAETKAQTIEALAKKEGFSLFCLIEEV